MEDPALAAVEVPSPPTVGACAPPPVSDPPSVLHGQRSTYRHGCRCTPCRASNSNYWRAWWRAKKDGRRLLGARISAAEAHRVIKLLKLDWRARAERLELSRTLGIRDLPRLTRQQRITLRTELKIRHLYRTRVLEDPDRRRATVVEIAARREGGVADDARRD